MQTSLTQRCICPASALCLLLAGALAPPAWSDPSPASLRLLWEGGAWSQDFAHGGGFLSGYTTEDAYLSGAAAPNPIPLKPAAQRVANHIRNALAKGSMIFAPYTQCHPPGMPYIFTMDGYGGWNIVVGDQELVMLYPNNDYRRIYTDGRPHLDPRIHPPTYNGDSIGQWQHGVFVVDTVNIRGSNTQIEPYIPKAEGTHIVERYTPTAPGVMALDVVMENPDFTRPWHLHFTLRRDPTGKLIQAMCTDANRYAPAAGEGLAMHGADGKPLPRAED